MQKNTVVRKKEQTKPPAQILTEPGAKCARAARKCLSVRHHRRLMPQQRGIDARMRSAADMFDDMRHRNRLRRPRNDRSPTYMET
jgi:hypothetical protein